MLVTVAFQVFFCDNRTCILKQGTRSTNTSTYQKDTEGTSVPEPHHIRPVTLEPRNTIAVQQLCEPKMQAAKHRTLFFVDGKATGTLLYGTKTGEPSHASRSTNPPSSHRNWRSHADPTTTCRKPCSRHRAPSYSSLASSLPEPEVETTNDTELLYKPLA
jgi:hypothetical protein